MKASPRRGFIYYANLDKRRPVVVISADARNRGASDVLVLPCSTILSDAPTHVRLRKGEGGLPATSVVKCEQITNVLKHELDARNRCSDPVLGRVGLIPDSRRHGGYAHDLEAAGHELAGER